MYNFFLAVQWVGIAILVGEIIYIMQKKSSQVQALLLAMDIFILINYIGYYFELKATSQELAIQAVKFIYVGKPFIALTILFTIMICCKIRITGVFKAIMIVMHLGITTLVFFSQYNTLFYSSIGWTQEGIYPHLVLGHGPVYKIYSSAMIIYFIAIIIMVARRFRQSPSENEKKQLYILTMMVGVVLGGFIWYLSGTTKGYDTTLPGYLIAVILLSIAMLKYQLLDTVSFAKDEALEYYKEGFLVVDNYNEILYANNKAEEIRSRFKKNGRNVSISHLLERIESKPELFLENDVYEVIARDIIRNNVKYGTLITINDITNKYYYAERLTEEVKKKTREVTFIQHSVLTSMASMIEARDGITGLHIKNTSNYVKILVEGIMKSDKYKDILDRETAEIIIAAAPLHDIGKIAVPDYVLKKPGKLTKEEFDIIKQHPKQGAKIIDETLINVEEDLYLEIARKMAYYHHEKWDGTGYPKGLKREEIPLCARIMAIADVYDALLSKRSYKEAFTIEKAQSIMRESSGQHFEPKLVDIFLECINEEK